MKLDADIKVNIAKIIIELARKVGYRFVKNYHDLLEFKYRECDSANSKGSMSLHAFNEVIKAISEDKDVANDHLIIKLKKQYIGSFLSVLRRHTEYTEIDNIEKPNAFWILGSLFSVIEKSRDLQLRNLNNIKTKYFDDFSLEYDKNRVYFTFTLNELERVILSEHNRILDFRPENIKSLAHLFMATGIRMTSAYIDKDLLEVTIDYKLNYNIEKLIEMLGNDSTFELAKQAIRNQPVKPITDK